MYAIAMADPATLLIKRLVLRALLKDVNPLVARVISIPDELEIGELHDVFLSMLDWAQGPDFLIRIHAQKFASFRGKRLREFQLRRQEKFLYICDTLDLWEWETQVLDVERVEMGDTVIVCLEGRGAAPPQHCGGPRGYSLMLRRQEGGAELSDPATVAASVQLLSEAYPEEANIDWQFLEGVLNDGWKSVEARLERSGPLAPTRFSSKETNERLELLTKRRRWR